MSHPIGPKLRQGPFPGALLLDSATEHTRLFVTPLDKPGPSQRDEILVGVEQRTIGAPRTVTLDMSRAATIVRWLQPRARQDGYSTVLALPGSGPASVNRDVLALVRTADDLTFMPHLTVLVEHWTGETVRNHREFVLTGGGPSGQIGRFYDWLRAFWFDGLPNVPRRRPDESAEQFAARKRAEQAR